RGWPVATVKVPIDMQTAALSASSPNTGIPELIRTTPAPSGQVTSYGYAFSGASSDIESIYFELPLLNFGATATSMTLAGLWYTSATTGNLVMQCQVACVTAGDAVSLIA